jgi:uncharacterized membrane protein (DUF4010 family)
MIFNQNPLLFDLYKFFLAIALGALMGLERERIQKEHEGKDFAGIRTFMLISFMGALTAYLSNLYFDWLLAIGLSAFIILIVSAYILSSLINKKIGMTTEISATIAFIVGILLFKTTAEVAILIAIINTLILSFKSPLHEFAHKIQQKEFFDTIKFILIAFVILPLLRPIKNFGPFNAINLYEIWLMVVFVSSLSYVAYILIKILGSDKGVFLTGLLGGILSSTATVTSLANKSKESAHVKPLVGAAAFACSTMFIRMLIEVAVLNFSLIEFLAFPLVLLALIGFVSVSLLWRKTKYGTASVEYSSPLMLKPAIKFGIFYGFILLLSATMNYYFGTQGILISALIAGFADVDAITIYIAKHPEIAMEIGITAIILAAVVNTIVKVGIANFFGKKEYGHMLAKIMAPIIILGIIILFV